MVHGSSFPRRGKRPKATAQQNAGELYSGLYARKYCLPRAEFGQNEGGRARSNPAYRAQNCIVPVQAIRMLTN